MVEFLIVLLVYMLLGVILAAILGTGRNGRHADGDAFVLIMLVSVVAWPALLGICTLIGLLELRDN